MRCKVHFMPDHREAMRVISCNLPFKEKLSRFTTVPLEPWADQEYRTYPYKYTKTLLTLFFRLGEGGCGPLDPPPDVC